MMKKNVGTLDRAIRIILGILIAAAASFTQSWWGLIAILPLATGLVGWCPLYTLLHIDTRGRSERDDGGMPRPV